MAWVPEQHFLVKKVCDKQIKSRQGFLHKFSILFDHATYSPQIFSTVLRKSMTSVSQIKGPDPRGYANGASTDEIVDNFKYNIQNSTKFLFLGNIAYKTFPSIVAIQFPKLKKQPQNK